MDIFQDNPVKATSECLQGQSLECRWQAAYSIALVHCVSLLLQWHTIRDN